MGYVQSLHKKTLVNLATRQPVLHSYPHLEPCRFNMRWVKCLFTVFILIFIVFHVSLRFSKIQPRLLRLRRRDFQNGSYVLDTKTLIERAEKALTEYHSPRYDYEQHARDLLSAYKLSPFIPLERNEPTYLCSTFIKWSSIWRSNSAAADDVSFVSESQKLLVQNILHTSAQHERSHEGAPFCDWVVVVYSNPSHLSEQDISQQLHHLVAKNRSFLLDKQQSITVLLAPSRDDESQANKFYSECESYITTPTDHFSYNKTSHPSPCRTLTPSQAIHYHNPLLYSKVAMLILLLNIIPRYKYVWLLDSDLSLDGFNSTRFVEVHQSLHRNIKDTHELHVPLPLVSQPLIHEDTQYYPYLQTKSWEGNQSVVMSDSGFIEIQAPLLYGPLLEWYIMSFIVPLYPVLHVLGADWGFDELFCSAARSFYRQIAHANANDTSFNESNSVCSIITAKGTSIHHHNSGEIAALLGGIDAKKSLNLALIDIVRRCYGNFAHNGFFEDTDPFSASGRKLYKQYVD